MAVYLAAKSALTRSDSRPGVQDVVEPLLLAGRIATCGIIDLELLFSAPDPGTYAELGRVLRSLPRVPVTDAAMDRALELQGVLAARSQHRSVPLPDLMVAACAELAGLTYCTMTPTTTGSRRSPGNPSSGSCPGAPSPDRQRDPGLRDRQ